MENWTQRIFLAPCRHMNGVVKRLFFNKELTNMRFVALWVAMLSSGVFTQTSLAQEKPLIAPDVKPQVVDESLIDTENFEVGGFVGVINIEDFESSILLGGRIAYHLSEHFFFEGIYAIAEGGETSFEKLGNVQLLTDSDRDYSYYSFGFGVNTPGQLFLPGNYTFNTNFYLAGGIGATTFAGDDRFTYSFGAGYQVLLTDWIALHITAKEHVYKVDLLGEEKNSFNSEFSSGLTFFF